MRIPLNGGAYEARSLTAGAQKCINLIPERVPENQKEPSATAHYPTPGLVLQTTIGAGPWRCLYRATNGSLYGVSGTVLVRMDSIAVATAVGALNTSVGAVSMADNGVSLFVVDSGPNAAGYTLLLADNTFAIVSDEAFYGGDRVDVLDGYFVFNRPATSQFYLSDNIATTFDPLWIAAKAGLDRLVSLTVSSRQLWLFGETKTEIYTDTGAADFPLQAISGGIEHGCAAAHSVARTDGVVFWLSRSKDGQGIVLQGSGYEAKRVSTHAIEAVIQEYARIDDARGWIYQLGGHTVYVLTFLAAGHTWCYDLATELWHEWVSEGGAHRGVCHAEAFGLNLVGDRANGNLYALDFDVYTDNGAPIQRTRSFPHIVNGGKRVFYTKLVLDMQCGTAAPGAVPAIQLRWSDDRGATYGEPLFKSLGTTATTLTQVDFPRLGMARDRVFEVSWSAAIPTVLQGAWVETRAAGT